MFYPIKGGEKIMVGEGFLCWTPPVPTDHSLIIGYGLPKEEQYWKREPIPKWYLDRSLEEEFKQSQDKELVIRGKKKFVYVDPMCERYRRREWHRRMFGVWFMNNGVPTYLTGHHYFYLQWCKFDHKENNGYPFYYHFSLDNFYVRQWCEENPRSMGYMIIGPRATGKCLGKGTQVMMYHGGFKNVEDVIVGDLLMGADSTPRKVLSLSTGIDNLFEVVQNRGINYVVNSKHILSLKRNTGKSFIGRNKKGKYKANYPNIGHVLNIPVLEFANKSQTFKNTFSGYKVGVEYKRKSIEIDPYFLGLWLGDGASQYPRITNIDKEIIDWLKSFCESQNLNLVRVAESKINREVASYTLSSKGPRSSKNHLLDQMRGYELINNKHIPDSYLYNTKEIRLKLLAGLIDTDGYFDRGRYEIVQVRRNLAEQIEILVNSLGFRAKMSEKIINGITYYRLGFSGKIDVPVLLDRKKNRGIPNKDNLITRIDEINYLGKGEFFGFELDGDHLFCLKDGTVTHNTNEELACITNRATMLHNHRAALQSKHLEDDAKGVLIQAKMVPLFNALPKFFKPEFAHGTNTQSELVFRRRSVGGKESVNVEYGPDLELLSTIFAAGPGEKVLDSDTLSDLFEDEIGKCIKYDTQVLTFSGRIKKANEISISDKLMGPDSTERNILQITKGVDQGFKIIPKKSGWNPWECVSGHKLSLKWCWKDRTFKFNGKEFHKDDTVVMTIDSFLKLNKTQRKHLMLFKTRVDYKAKPVFIDPYLIGIWLGDGDRQRMTITAIENEIIESIYSYGVKITKASVNDRSPRYHLHGYNPFLKFYNLKHNKHIPFDYLINSRDNRLQLLAGLIDTDGHSTIDGNRLNCEITQKNKRLALDIQRLVTELGFSCSFEPKIATMKRYDGSIYKCEVYRMFFFGDLSEIPVRVKRKQFPKIKVHNKNRKNPLRSGFSVEKTTMIEYVGFVIDKDKLHLLGDCQVTHNTNPKTVADVYVRHEVNLKCVFRNNRKIGLLRKTSTVEEMNEGGEECLKLRKDSNMKVLDGNGFTTSKIHFHLISALDTDTSLVDYIDATGKNYGPPCDKFGNVNRQIANTKIQHDFDAVKHDLKKLSGRMRKSPRNETEAFIKDQSKSIFNVMLLSDRLENIRNHMIRAPYVRGNLYWVKEKFGPVWWQRDDHAGRFNWAWFPDEFSKIKEPDKAKILNNVGSEMGYDRKGFSRRMLFPKNDHLFRIGSDPIKYSKTKDPRASKASIHGFRLYDGMADYGKDKKDWESHNFIFEYIERPEDPETSFEDTAMACIFLGCKLLPERNVPSLNDYFETNGLERFLAYPKDFVASSIDIQTSSEDAGFSTTGEVIDYYTRRIISFINNHIHRMPFDNTIEDWMNFDPTNPTKSDATVSSGFTLVHAEKKAEIEPEPEQSLADWFDTYDNSGVQGIFVDNENLGQLERIN